MSTLSVDTIQGQTTAATVKLPAGSILQTVTKDFSGTITTITSSGVTFTDITDATITITPKYNNSKILIIPNIEFYLQDSTSVYIYSAFRCLRGSSTVLGPANPRDGNGGYDYGIGVNPGSNLTTIQFGSRYCAHHTDTPATTSATTYKFQGQCYSAGRSLVINGGDAGSSILAMEISV